ncbi:MAG: hypothetical protein SGILL_002640, partial [Bacillariaceae sp.]
HSHKTPSKHRVNLGAPANYYFKYMDSVTKQSLGDANDSILTHGDGDDIGTNSIPGHTPNKGGGGGGNTEMSYLSMAASSSGSEASDLLNKSTLSDTTELTASNFVLATTSKQQLVRSAFAAQKATASNRKLDHGGAQPMTGKENQENTSVQSSAKKPPAIGKGSENGSESQFSMGMSGMSPSLRSRVGSSPATLRQYKDSLVNARLKRQVQREDSERRLSTDSAASIPFMHAQLEALTTDTVFSRQRLPPAFAKLSRSSQETNEMHSTQLTPAGSVVALNCNESTSLDIDMKELDALLGTTGTNQRGEESSITAHRSSIDAALGKQTRDLNFSNIESGSDKNTAAFSVTNIGSVTKDSSGITSPSLPRSIELSANSSGLGTDSQFGEGPVKQNFSTSSPPHSELRLTPGSSRRKLASSNLSSGPRRVLNPQSILSPAKNTRSAKKLRKHEETQDGHDSLLLSANRSNRLSLANSVVTTTSQKSDETASPGDLADLFGSSNSQARSDSRDLSAAPIPTGESQNESFLQDESKSVEGYGDSADFEQTALLEDVHKLLDSKLTRERDSPRFSDASDEKEQDLKETASLGSIQEVLGSQSSRNDGSHAAARKVDNDPIATTKNGMSPGEETLREKSGTEVPADQQFDTHSVPKDLLENSTSVNQGVFASPSNDIPSTPPEVNLSAMSPGVNRLLSQLKSSVPEKSPFKKNRESDTVSVPTKEPMRLKPNAHVAPTPTKLDPTPRRVLNPNNPNSPARNTRSASRTKSPLPGEGDNSNSICSGDKHPREALAKPAQLFQEEGVERHSKRRRSSSIATPWSQAEEPARARGIMSSKKKPASVQRSVAFGSPEAAEYNVGSPSVSLTPMPRGRAKALYRLPKGRENTQETQQGTDEGANESGKENRATEGGGSQTMEIEPDLQVLVDKINVENMNDSPELSPIAKTKSDTGVFHVPRDLSIVNPLDSVKSTFSPRESADHQAEQTVELEGGIDDLLAFTATNASPHEDDTSAEFESNFQENSIEMADAESIASIHSRKSEKFTAEFNISINGQKLDFSVASEDSPPAKEEPDLDVDAGNTVEIEGNMTSLLEANGRNGEQTQDVESNESKEVSKIDMSIHNGGMSVMTEAKDAGTKDLEGGMTDVLALSHFDQPETRTSNSLTESTSQVGQTVELELNMTDLLAGACDDLGKDEKQSAPEMNVASSTNGGDDDQSEVEVANRKTRRKTISQDSFTLRQPDQLQVSVADVEQRSMAVHEKSVSFVDTAEFIVSVLPSPALPVEHEEPNMLRQEDVSHFSNAVFQELTEQGDPLSMNNGDALSLFGKFSGDSDAIVLERWCKFLELVCGEVERNTDPEGAAVSELFENVDGEPVRYSTLHTKLNIEKGHGKFLTPIIENGQKAAKFEWNDWLGTVLQSFQGPLDSIPVTLDEDFSRLDSVLEKCQLHQSNIAMMKTGNAEKAKQKSLARRKEAAVDLEEHIKELQAKLSDLESELESLENEQELVKTQSDLAEETKELIEENDRIHSEANASQKAFLSLRGVHSWSLGPMNEDEVRVCSLGSCAQTSFSASYNIEESGDVVPKLLANTISSSTALRFRYHASISSYLQVCMRQLAMSIGLNRLPGTSEIGPHIQKHAWLVGRLDLAARELHVLQRRYKATISRTSGDSFSMRIVFERKQAGIEVEFPLDPMYPAFPVEVQLDLVAGEVDFGALRKSLIKQSKPGFGSLSRACDIVESFVKR